MHDAQSSAKQTTKVIKILCFMERRSNITPGITRRPELLSEHEILRVGGRVHPVVELSCAAKLASA